MGSFEISEAWLVIIIIIIAIARVVTGGAIQQFLWNALAYYYLAMWNREISLKYF